MKKALERKTWEWKEIERAVKFLFTQTYYKVDISKAEYVAIVESKLKKEFYKPHHPQ